MGPRSQLVVLYRKRDSLIVASVHVIYIKVYRVCVLCYTNTHFDTFQKNRQLPSKCNKVTNDNIRPPLIFFIGRLNSYSKKTCLYVRVKANLNNGYFKWLLRSVLKITRGKIVTCFQNPIICRKWVARETQEIQK